MIIPFITSTPLTSSRPCFFPLSKSEISLHETTRSTTTLHPSSIFSKSSQNPRSSPTSRSSARRATTRPTLSSRRRRAGRGDLRLHGGGSSGDSTGEAASLEQTGGDSVLNVDPLPPSLAPPYFLSSRRPPYRTRTVLLRRLPFPSRKFQRWNHSRAKVKIRHPPQLQTLLLHHAAGRRRMTRLFWRM